MPLDETFSLTRVINLPERRDRYREMAAQLEAMGMGFAPGRVEVYAAERVGDAAGFTSAAVRGCFLSHLNVLRDAQARGVESVLVLEDDLEVAAENVARLDALAAELRGREWGIAYLGHFLPAAAEQHEPRWEGFVGDLQTAHFYAVHGSALGRLIAYLEQCLVRPEGDPVGGPMEYDGALSMFRRWNPDVATLVVQPSLGGQRSSRSSIHARRMESVPGVGAVLGLLRKARRKLR
jgi:glycosyl transferase family 25